MIQRRVVECKFAGSDGSATATGRIDFGRPGILRAIKLTSPGQPGGMDGTIKDEIGNTLVTFTNVGNSTVFGPVITDGWTDEGVAATDLGQGAPFRNALAFSFTSGDADIGSQTDDGPAICVVWVEV